LIATSTSEERAHPDPPCFSEEVSIAGAATNAKPDAVASNALRPFTGADERSGGPASCRIGQVTYAAACDDSLEPSLADGCEHSQQRPCSCRRCVESSRCRTGVLAEAAGKSKRQIERAGPRAFGRSRGSGCGGKLPASQPSTELHPHCRSARHVGGAARVVACPRVAPPPCSARGAISGLCCTALRRDLQVPVHRESRVS